MKFRIRTLIIIILFLGVLILYVITGLYLMNLILNGDVYEVLSLTEWMAFMNSYGINFSKTLVLLIFPIAFIGIIKYRGLERDQKLIIGKLTSFVSIIILIVVVLFNQFYLIYEHVPTNALISFYYFDLLNLVLYIVIFVLMRSKTK